MKKYILLLSTISFLCVSGAAVAEKEKNIGTIEDIRYVPGTQMNQLVIHHERGAIFKISPGNNKKQIIIDIQGANFPAGLTRKINTASIPGPVKEIIPYNSGDNKTSAKVLVNLREVADVMEEKSTRDYKVLFLQENSKPEKLGKYSKAYWSKRPGYAKQMSDKIKLNAYAVDKSLQVAEELIKTLETPVDARVYKGTKVTIESENVNVHDVFRLVGSASGLNIITTSEVNGSLSLSLKDVPWDQLLDIVLQERQLKASSNGNVIRITSIENYNNEQQAKLKLMVVENKIEPVMMAIIPISYAKVTDIKTSISKLLVGALNSSGASTTVAGQQSDADAVQAFVRGQIEVDERTNSLLVTHTAEQIRRIRTMVKELDVPTPQVLIESKIVQASDSFSKTLGVDWGGFFQKSRNGVQDTNAGGGGFAFNSFQSDAAFSITNDAATTGSGLFGIRLGNGLASHLDLSINLAEVNQQAKVMASPRVIVNNKQTATITDGTKLAVVTTTSTGTGANNTTEFVTAALTMSVTPQITNSGQVLMDLTVNQDSPVSAGSARDIQTKAIKTQVMVDSGSTLVLGGVYSYNLTKSDSGTPWLKDLPLLGQLFRKDNNAQLRSELLVFVTPRVMESAKVEENEVEDEGITL